jgi:CRISPR-associated protein Cmr1
MAGAEQLPISQEGFEDLELRPPSIKGVLRWWYRAGKAEISPQENRIFGSTDQSSRCRLRIRPSAIPDQYKCRYLKSNFGDREGIQYLGFSLDTPVREGTRQRAFVTPGYCFNVDIGLLGGANEDDQNALLASLWLMTWLGAVGTRSRRGFGSLRITECSADSDLSFVFNGPLGQFREFLSTNLTLARSKLRPATSAAPLPNFTLLSPSNSKLLLWNRSFDTWEEALDTAGLELRDYRKQLGKGFGRPGPDYQQVKAFLKNPSHAPSGILRAAFGLPIQFYFGSLEREVLIREVTAWLQDSGVSNPSKKAEDAVGRGRVSRKRVQPSLQRLGMDERDIRRLFRQARDEATATLTGDTQRTNPEGHERRASPLLVKVAKINDKQYALMFLVMKAAILESGEKLLVKTGNRSAKLNPPQFKAVDDFLAEIAKNAWEIEI